MADSGAARQARYKAHRQNDHHLCKHDARGVLAAIPAGDDSPADPRSALEALWRRLEAVSIADPANAMVARELRAVLVVLAAPQDEDLDYG